MSLTNAKLSSLKDKLNEQVKKVEESVQDIKSEEKEKRGKGRSDKKEK